MLLSILIPTYNSAKTLKKAVLSAINQDYAEEYEIIVANNASTDNTSEILASIDDKRLRVINNKETVVISANHNILLKTAKSDYVVFLHADDELFPNALSIYADRIKMRKFPKRYIACGQSMYNDVHESMLRKSKIFNEPAPEYNTIISGESAMKIFSSGVLIQQTGTCYSRETILDLGGFLVLEKTCPEDWYMCALAAYNFFEFETIDRLLLKREFSSSWGKVNSEIEKQMRWMKVQKGFISKLNEQQMNFLMFFYHRYKYSFWEKYFNPLKVYKQRVLQKPWGLTRWKNYIQAKRELTVLQ